MITIDFPETVNQLNLYPESSIINTQVLFVNFGEKEATYSLKVMSQLRNNGISAELYPETGKMKKQMGYANSHNIPFVAIIGETEMQTGLITVKNMNSGEQQQITAEDFISMVKK